MKGQQMRRYIALVEEENGNYGVVFPDLPGVVSAGTSFDDAVQNAHELLAHVAKTQELPQPRTLEQIRQSWDEWKDWEKECAFIVTDIQVLPVSTKARRVNIMIDEDLLMRVDAVAKNRSEFISKVLEAALA